ncbi:shikimate kinase [uncultured Ruegeria sp.]|nr:shikimate kinase [uncultured Ruegeria sp.]
MDLHVFLIGPGGVGKTSSGPHLAKLLGREFVDLDEIFMSGPGHIGRYIKNCGYAQYVRENSKLFFEHIYQRTSPCVCALSSGFLIAEEEVEIVELNKSAVKKKGHSVLLLSHSDPDDCAKIVVARQVGRGLNLRQEIELPKFLARLPVYLSLADQVTVFRGRPEGAAHSIFTQLNDAQSPTADIC